MKLPRENPNAKYDVEVIPYENGLGENRIKVAIRQGRAVKLSMSLTEQETDDLIVMLTYYKNEQFPKAVADNG